MGGIRVLIILDTNVVSEVSKREGVHFDVQFWFRTQRSIGITSVTLAEVRFGIDRLPDGRRKRELLLQLERFVREDLNGNILSFDAIAANHFGLIAARRESMGRPIDIADCQIASICYANQLTLATRNIKDFEGIGIDLVNPWR
jgi:hypothetical protein